MNSVVYIRKSLADEEEIAAAEKYFPVIYRRTQIPKGALVIPRYSALPFNRELEEDVEALGATLINSNFEHSQIADFESWYNRLRGLTPKTWFDISQAKNELGPFVLKGRTNSKKHNWRTHMYAKDWYDALEVSARLQRDGFIGEQRICIRKYVPLRKLCDSISPVGPPVTEEYRFFVFLGQVLCSGFYWSSYLDDIRDPITPEFVPTEFLREVINRVQDLAKFLVIDVARTEDHKWIVIELNDGQQAGLCSISPEELYSELYISLGGTKYVR